MQREWPSTEQQRGRSVLDAVELRQHDPPFLST
jgi:hypothetical protein